MILKFRKPHRTCGYSMQMIVDTTEKICRVGYCLTIGHCYELKSKDFQDIITECKTDGYKIVNA